MKSIDKKLVCLSAFTLIICFAVITKYTKLLGGNMYDTSKINKNGVKVINEIWGEPEEDPRCVMGYQLKTSGKPFFDRYVILYGGRIVNRNCATNKFPDAQLCNKTGLHLHYDDNVYKYYAQQSEKYLQPLRKKGIKVLMGLVPKDSGVCIGVIGSWPMEDVWPWKQNNQDSEYPFGEKAVKAFAKEIAEELKRLKLDGVGYDEEYGNIKSVYGPGPSAVYPEYFGQYEYYTDAKQKKAAWKRGGENVFRFAYQLNKEMPGVIQDMYEIHYGEYVPKELEIDNQTVKASDLFDISFEPYYGSWQANSNFLPRKKYGPISIDIGSTSDGVKPANTNYGIVQNMNDHLAGGYGVNMFYCLRSRDEMQSRFPKFFNRDEWKAEGYLTRISNVLFGEETIYNGIDYPRLW
ncbi:MAG: hypothetical protein LBD07_00160 [Spirochaetaceae bacterium]|jgi:hypothetical protein|nr:hypothetical protein [Spirochaetaceae bacterium]